MPPAIDVIKRKRWSSKTKALGAFVLCLGAVAMRASVAGDIASSSDPVTAELVVFTGAQAMYHWFRKPRRISPVIEARTGLSHRRPHLELKRPRTGVR